jgi:hypothetical protein
MSIIKNIKGAFEWVEHFDFMIRTIISLGLGALLKAVVSIYTHLNPAWTTAIWLITSGLILACLSYAAKKIPKAPNQNELAPPATSGQFKNIDEFYRQYDNALLIENEEHPSPSALAETSCAGKSNLS